MRRKKDYHKAIRKKRLCQSIWGDAKYWLDGVLGKYDKGKIHESLDFEKTNSKRYGKRNYKASDRRRYDSTEYAIKTNYEDFPTS